MWTKNRASAVAGRNDSPRTERSGGRLSRAPRLNPDAAGRSGTGCSPEDRSVSDSCGGRTGTRTERRTRTPDEALAALMRLCARAEKCEGDARRLMRGWGLGEREAAAVLERLVRDRFIDDRRYAGLFVREKQHLSGWGPYKIRQALQRKEIDRATIEEALAALDPAAQRPRLEEQLRRKAHTAKAATPFELRTKLIRYGLSLGYSYETVQEAAASCLPQQNDEPCDEFFC